MIIKYFRWTIDYDANLAKKWLDWKLASVDGPEREYVEIMKSVVRDGNRPNLNNSESVRNLIAEYVGYQNAPPSATAHLFYVTGDDGWAIFPELPPTPLAIKVRPDDDDADKIALTFTQMTQQVYADVGNGLKVRGTIKRFTYQIQFAYLDPAKTMLQATLWHPDAGKSEEPLKVGDTTLKLIIKGKTERSDEAALLNDRADGTSQFTARGTKTKARRSSAEPKPKSRAK